VKRRTTLSAIFALSSALGSPRSSPETEPVARIPPAVPLLLYVPKQRLTSSAQPDQAARDLGRSSDYDGAAGTTPGDHRWGDILDAHDAWPRRQLARYRGTLVKATGDRLVATFDGPARPIRCALALRDGLRSICVEIRGGLHCGEIERRGPDVSGLAVHIAGRVHAVARPGEMLVTRTVKDLVVGAEIPLVRNE
jgi:class 3 adenylate cyclase